MIIVCHEAAPQLLTVLHEVTLTDLRCCLLQVCKSKDFAQQINLNMDNCWGIVRALVDLCLNLDEGKYLLVKEPNKPIIRLYNVPGDSFTLEQVGHDFQHFRLLALVIGVLASAALRAGCKVNCGCCQSRRAVRPIAAQLNLGPQQVATYLLLVWFFLGSCCYLGRGCRRCRQECHDKFFMPSSPRCCRITQRSPFRKMKRHLRLMVGRKRSRTRMMSSHWTVGQLFNNPPKIS